MPRHPFRPLAALLLLGLAVSGAATNTARWGRDVPVCQDGTLAAAPSPCPPPLHQDR